MPENNNLFKLQVPKIKYGYQIKRNGSISKINNVACSSTNLFSLYYEPWFLSEASRRGSTCFYQKYCNLKNLTSY